MMKASRKKANDAIYTLTANKYFDAIPIDALIAACENAGFGFEPEEINCFLCGAEGRATWSLHDAVAIPGCYTPMNAMLVLTWYKMPSGRYEVVSYVS